MEKEENEAPQAQEKEDETEGPVNGRLKDRTRVVTEKTQRSAAMNQIICQSVFLSFLTIIKSNDFISTK